MKSKTLVQSKETQKFINKLSSENRIIDISSSLNFRRECVLTIWYKDK